MPKALRTVVDRDLPPLQVAERRLADLSRQRRNRLVTAAALALLAIAVGLAYPQFGIALAVGAVAALVAAAAAVSQRRARPSARREAKNRTPISSSAVSW